MLPNVVSLGLSLNNYLKIREASALLGVHPDTLRRWGKVGRLNTYRHPVNRYRLYLKEDLYQFLKMVSIE